MKLFAAIIVLLLFAGTANAGTASAYGDSITVSYGVPAGQGWVSDLSSDLGYTVTNDGISGAQAADLMLPVYNHTWAIDSFVTLMIGANDQRIYQSSAPLLGYYELALGAEAYFLTENTVNTQTLTQTGGWTTNSPYTIGLSVHASGATLTGSFTGSTLTFGYVQQNTGTGQFSVTVDGVNVGTFNCYPAAAMTTYLGATYGPALGRVTGLGSGMHTVVFTTLNSGYVYIDWLGQSPNGKPLYLASITRFSSAGYASAGGSDADNASYNSAISSLISQMKGDGLNVIAVDEVDTVNPATDLQSDGVHPGTAIQPAMAAAFCSAIPGCLSFQPISIYEGSDGNYYLKNNAGSYLRLDVP